MRAPGVDQEPEDFGQRDLEQNAVPSVPMDPTLCETLTFLVWAVVTVSPLGPLSPVLPSPIYLTYELQNYFFL